jgi:hypothetical protein
LEAQRISCFELRTIFPVTVSQRYLILGLIPSDLYAGTVSEEEVSAALGYLVHLVAMMSKYLAIPLRYRHCNSSRSAIQGDRAAAYRFRGGRWNEDNWNMGLGCWIEMWNAFVRCVRLPAKARVLHQSEVSVRICH